MNGPRFFEVNTAKFITDQFGFQCLVLHSTLDFFTELTLMQIRKNLDLSFLLVTETRFPTKTQPSFL